MDIVPLKKILALLLCMPLLSQAYAISFQDVSSTLDLDTNLTESWGASWVT